MTHKGNLLAKNGWSKIAWAQRHMEMISKLHTVFSYKIMRQLYKGMCLSEQEKYQPVRKTCDWRFNCSLLPMQNINKHIGAIIKTLKFVVKHKKECKKYREIDLLYRNGRAARPAKPDEIILLDYWDSPSKIMLNHMMEILLDKCEQFGNIVGTKIETSFQIMNLWMNLKVI